MADRIREDDINKFPTIGEPKQQSDTGFASRRRLVKGAILAMPAIMTLRGGAALAATSAVCQESQQMASCYTSIMPQGTQPLDVESTTSQQGTSTIMLESEETIERSGTSKDPWRSPWN